MSDKRKKNHKEIWGITDKSDNINIITIYTEYSLICLCTYTVSIEYEEKLVLQRIEMFLIQPCPPGVSIISGTCLQPHLLTLPLTHSKSITQHKALLFYKRRCAHKTSSNHGRLNTQVFKTHMTANKRWSSGGKLSRAWQWCCLTLVRWFLYSLSTNLPKIKLLEMVWFSVKLLTMLI